MVTLALFGPPGVGKSTLVSQASKVQAKGVDLEDAGSSSSERSAAIESINFETDQRQLIGTADTQATEYSDKPETVTVLLLPDKDEYLARVEARNEERPEKAGQGEEATYEGFKSNESAFDFVINTSGPIEQTFTMLEDIFQQLEESLEGEVEEEEIA